MSLAEEILGMGPRALAYVGHNITAEPALRDGAIMSMSGHIVIGTAPWTDRERDAELARRIVRTGLADILTWLGETPGPRPDDPMPTIGGRQILEHIKAHAQPSRLLAMIERQR